MLKACTFFNNDALAAMQFFKTYQDEYGIEDHVARNELMPFVKLKQINDPYQYLRQIYGKFGKRNKD